MDRRRLGTQHMVPYAVVGGREAWSPGALGSQCWQPFSQFLFIQ